MDASDEVGAAGLKALIEEENKCGCINQ